MAIQLSETFRVAAPVERVWGLLIDPAWIVRCMPEASLDGVEDERTSLGSVAVRIGAISTHYRGRGRFEALDEAGRTVRAACEAALARLIHRLFGRQAG